MLWFGFYCKRDKLLTLALKHYVVDKLTLRSTNITLTLYFQAFVCNTHEAEFDEAEKKPTILGLLGCAVPKMTIIAKMMMAMIIIIKNASTNPEQDLWQSSFFFSDMHFFVPSRIEC